MATQATTIDDLNGLLRTMMKSALERMLNTEMDVHLGRKPLALPTDTPPAIPNEPAAKKNRRNGHSHKTVGGDLGELTLDTPRDRDGTFEPQLILKHQRRLAGFDDKILALYAKGMTTGRSEIALTPASPATGTPSNCARREPWEARAGSRGSCLA